MTGSRRKAVSVAVGTAIAVAALGGLATDTEAWYRALVKPSWQPPDWLFGPAWTTIYALTVIAGVRAWENAKRRGHPNDEREWMLAAVAANAFLNVLWSLLFFRLHRPDWALLEVGVLWSSVLALAVTFGRSDRVAALLVSPYLAWVGFASFLNLAIVELNAPFEGR